MVAMVIMNYGSHGDNELWSQLSYLGYSRLQTVDDLSGILLSTIVERVLIAVISMTSSHFCWGEINCWGKPSPTPSNSRPI